MSDEKIFEVKNPSFDLMTTHHAPSQKITTQLLNGRNISSSARSFCLFYGTKGKIDWLRGKIPTPKESGPTSRQWLITNCTILEWMFNFMESRVYETFQFYEFVPLL